MAKYDSQLAQVKSQLPSLNNVLIALPSNADIDRLAAGLALYLSLKQAGKQVSIVSETPAVVSQSHLFAVNEIQNSLPQASSGDYTLVLEDVAVSDPNSPTGGKVPSLEKLDYKVDGKNLNLIFKVIPGQTFQPSRIVPQLPQQPSGFNLIFTIGASGLNSLGNIYLQNQSIFSGSGLVNIDNQATNMGFGQANVVDPAASSVSEIMTEVILGLAIPFEGDNATNLLTGIFEATNNLTSLQASADTYSVIANCLRVGGQKPAMPTASTPAPTPQPQPTLNLNMFTPQSTPPTPSSNVFVNPPVAPANPEPTVTTPTFNTPPATPSAEERPQGEMASSDNPEVEPGWLTPKVFKGSSAG